MNKNYWIDFYSNHTIPPPSDFADRCVMTMHSLAANDSIIDLGCGNGRDSIHFANKGMAVCAVDYAPVPLRPHHINISWVTEDALNVRYDDNVYARWFLHAISDSEAERFFKKVNDEMPIGSLLMLEFRAIDPKFREDSHARRLLDINDIISKLTSFEVLYAGTSRGWSVLGDDDPLLSRIIAKRI